MNKTLSDQPYAAQDQLVNVYSTALKRTEQQRDAAVSTVATLLSALRHAEQSMSFGSSAHSFPVTLEVVRAAIAAAGKGQ